MGTGEAQRFRKRPVVIEARQWFNPGVDIQAWTNGCIAWGSQSGEPAVYDELHMSWIDIEDGDWIIKGIRGEFYPCKPDVFAETYEAVT